MMLITELDFKTLIRAFYIASATAILCVRLVPFLRDHFIAYGAREHSTGKRDAKANQTKASIGGQIVKWIADWKVPHSWFTHFYVCSVISSLLWLYQFYCRSTLFSILEIHSQPIEDTSNLPVSILLMLIQGLRRLYECLYVLKPGHSTMWIGHYIIGLTFYLLINVAIWIEGIKTIDSSIAAIQFSELCLMMKMGCGILMFIIASIKQHQSHTYLSRLTKYTFPNAGEFRNIIAPHYTAECAIYLSLALISAPPDQYFNITVLLALVFVVINLGVTADGTKKWMLDKFSDHRREINSRWKMLPRIW